MTHNPFGPEVIAAVSRHMNDDHAADSLVIVRGLGDTPDATAARMTHLDGLGVDFAVTVTGSGAGAGTGTGAGSSTGTGTDAGSSTGAGTGTGAERTVRVPFSRPLTERPEIRHEIVRLYTEAAAVLGLEPRTED